MSIPKKLLLKIEYCSDFSKREVFFARIQLMNEIESDISGIIVKILIENGEPVEFNNALFLIKPD